MSPQPKNFSNTCSRGEHPPGIERHGEKLLAIHDMPTGPRLKLLFWVVAGGIPVLVVATMLTTQSVSAVLACVFVLFVVAAAKGRRTCAEIDLADRTIRMKWGIGALSRQKVYSLDDYTTVKIKDNGQVYEGYSMPLFSVLLVGGRKQIALYATDDPEEAMTVKGEIRGFISKAGISTQLQQTG